VGDLGAALIVAAWKRSHRAAVSTLVIAASMASVPVVLAPAGATPAPARTPTHQTAALARTPACEAEEPSSLGEALEGAENTFRGASAISNALGSVASAVGDEATGEGLTSLGEGLGVATEVAGYGFAWVAFTQANAAFGYGADDPTDKNFKAIFMPVFASIPLVPAPTARLDGSFAALNNLFATESRFAEVVVALRTALDRAAGATAAGNQLWFGRQADASANYALEAAELLQEFSPLRAAVVKAFTAEGLTLKLTSHQFAEAQTGLAHGLPSNFTKLLLTAAAAVQPQTNSEVKAFTTVLLNTKALQRVIAKAKPTSLDLPTLFGSRLLTAAEARVAAALAGYADYVLQSPNKTYHPDYLIANCGGGGGGGGGGTGASFGEPHENTFSGDDYEFQAVGEFTLVKSTTDNLDVQIRQQAFPGSGDVSFDTATAMRVGNAIVELAASPNGFLQLWVDRKSVPLASQPLAGGGRLSVSADRFATVTWPDGTEVSVFSTVSVAVEHGTATCNGARVIYVFVKVPRSRYGHLTGLLGDAGQPEGSNLLGGNGISYSLHQLYFPSENLQNFNVLYHQFGQSWRVTPATSLFAYPKGESTASYTDLSFPSKALTVSSLRPATAASAEVVCKASGITNPDLLVDCVFDLGVTASRCFVAGDAQIQAATGGPNANGLPPSSGTVPPATTTATSTTTSASTTGPTTTQVTTAPSGHGPVPIGTTTGGSPAEPAVAVGPSGTAYTVLLQPGGTQLDFCALPVGSTTCTPVPLKVPGPSTDLFSDPPTVLLHDGDIYVFEYIGSASDNRTGIAEYVSTDGGASFTLQPDAVSYVKGGQGTTGPIVELPGGEFGAGYVSDVTNPTFQANSLSAPSNDSQATTPPYATLNPSPATAYTVGNLGGQFASQLTGSRGVLGVFVGDGAPCPSSAHSTLVYAYAPISASTSLEDLNTTTGGSGSPWGPLAKVDCGGTYPAVAGGPSGLGLLETDLATPTTEVQYRAFSPGTGFGAPVTIAKDESALDPTLSQDATGRIYATWVNAGVGIELSSSAPGGASWTAPATLLSVPGTESGIDNLTSGVNASGQGWAVYTRSGKDYALEFSKNGASS
jgi:hypothetical protein